MLSKKHLQWTDQLVTGHQGIDIVHLEFIELVNALVDAQDSELLAYLLAFQTHAVAHFAEENRLMQLKPYPSAGCHIEEHQAVLSSVAEVVALVESGNVTICRELSAELVRWFPEHTEEMDKSFVHWQLRQSLGAAPLVFHRSARLVANTAPTSSGR